MRIFSILLLLFFSSCMSANKASDLAGGASTNSGTGGSGTALPQSALVVTPSTFSFGTKSLATSTAQTFTVYNQADVTATINSLNLTGSMYTITGDTCTGVTLAAASSCTVSVTFTPTSPGNFVAFVTIDLTSTYSNITSTTFNMNGAGAGAQPTLTISPATYAFGNVATNAVSSVLFTISNPSSVTAYAVTASISGTDFTILSETCGGNNLSSGASCAVTVRFTPTATLSRAGTLTLSFNSLEGVAYTSTASLTGTGTTPVVAFAFSGFNNPGTDTSSLTPTGVQLNWTAEPLATRYRITRVLPLPVTTIITINTPATSSYVVSGLTPSESYQYRINAFDSLDVSDGNNNLASFTTPTGVSATFNGWSDVIATGSVYSDVGVVDTAWGNVPTGVAPAPPTWPTSMTDSLHIVSTSATKQNAVVKLAWDAFTFSGGGVSTSHKIYRATVSGGPYTDITTAGSNVLSGYTFIDNGVSNETTYYYKVHPVQGVEITPGAAVDTEIKVYVPPQNMVLMHRWIANRETCVNLLGKTWPTDFDRANNYRCNYVWGRSSAVAGCPDPSIVDVSCNHAFAAGVPWNDKAYWDIGHTMIADRYESGCKISPRVGSVGSALPGGGFLNGEVFYAQALAGGAAGSGGSTVWPGRCYINDAGTWKSYVAGTATVGQHASATTNQPGYPPAMANQSQAYSACQQRSVAGVGALRLWRRYEVIAAKAWSGDHNTRTNIQVANYTSGVDLATNGSCNTQYGNGLVTTSPIIDTPKYVMNTITGSWATRNCYSRYELQDQIGNVSEWTSDQMYGCNINNSCTFGVSALDTGNILMDGFVMNNSQGISWNPNSFSDPGYYYFGIYWLWNTPTTFIPMLGVASPTVDSNRGSRTLAAGILTQETGLGVSRVNSTLSLLDGIFSPGRLSFAPVINSHYGLMLGDPSGVPGGSYNPYGYRCVGEVP